MPKKIKLPKNRPLHIAIVGIDASGKTTLAERLKKKFEKETNLATDVINFPKIEMGSRAVKRTMRFLEEIEYAAHARDRKNVVKAVWTLMGFTSQLKKVTASNKDVLLYDREPCIEPLVYADYYGSKAVHKLLSSMQALPDIVIKLDCSPETCIKRLRERLKGLPVLSSPRKKGPQLHEKDPKALEGIDRSFDRVVGQLETKYHIPVPHIDGESKFEKTDPEKSMDDVCGRAFAELKKIIDA